jgi:hypothetical protein
VSANLRSPSNPRGAFPTPQLNIESILEIKSIRTRANKIKEILIQSAIDQLPGKVGRGYTNVVLSCLTCLDRNNDGFGDESNYMDEDGILIGIRYIEKVTLPFILCLAYADHY